jgi:hypothetical protein
MLGQASPVPVWATMYRVCVLSQARTLASGRAPDEGQGSRLSRSQVRTIERSPLRFKSVLRKRRGGNGAMGGRGVMVVHSCLLTACQETLVMRE